MLSQLNIFVIIVGTQILVRFSPMDWSNLGEGFKLLSVIRLGNIIGWPKKNDYYNHYY